MNRYQQSFIPYGLHSLDTQDIRSVTKALKSDKITQGPLTAKFEDAFARYCDVPYAVAVSSGTAALHLACLAAGFHRGDQVVTTPMTFLSTANAILYSGATPRFSDIDKKDNGLDFLKVRKCFTRKTKGIIAVDYAGMPSVVNRFDARFGRASSVTIIEDACHALGASYVNNARQLKVGSSVHSDMTIFSFHPVKHITTGEGGMITTRRKDLYDKLILLRNHGIERRPSKFIHKEHAQDPWYYEMNQLGFNYRLSDLQCALGLSQIKKIDAFVAKRREIAHFYDKAFQNVKGIKIPDRIKGRKSSYHLYVLRIDFDSLGISRRQVMHRLNRSGIGTQVHFIPITRQPFYRHRFAYRVSDFPECEALYASALSIPIYPDLTSRARAKVASAIKELISGTAGRAR